MFTISMRDYLITTAETLRSIYMWLQCSIIWLLWLQYCVVFICMTPMRDYLITMAATLRSIYMYDTNAGLSHYYGCNTA